MRPMILLVAALVMAICRIPWIGVAAAQEDDSVQTGYDRAIQNLERHWWDASNRIPRIRPTRGDNSGPNSLDVGTTDNSAPRPSFWQMAHFANIQYWNWRITRSPAMKAKILSQWQYIRSVYSDKALSSASKSHGIVNASDDGAWALNYLVQVHEVTGDRRALQDAMLLLASILNRFADPNAPRIHYGTLKASPYGILYATASDDPDHQGCSTTFEIMMAASALSIYHQTHNPDYLKYAVGTFDWTMKYLKHPDRGYYYCELDIRPTAKGTRNPHYLKPLGDYFGPPVRGLSSSYSGGTMAMAVVAARLHNITGEQPYLEEARRITSDYVRRDAFLRPGDMFVNERDGWTCGYWAPYFADEVLALTGVDSSGLWKKAIRNTAISIISRQTWEGFYGADWSGPERNSNDGSMTWEEQARRGTGSGRGMALPNQIMTSSSSVAMLTAARIVDSRPGAPKPPTPAVPASDFPQYVRTGGCEVIKLDNVIVLKGPDNDRAQILTTREFKPPFVLRVEAKTDSKNLRLYYNAGILVFNWERNENELRIHDPATNETMGVADKGKIEPEKFHDILWEVYPKGMRVIVDGKERARKLGDYERLEAAIGIGPAYGSTVTVKSFQVEVLKGKLPE